MLNTDVCVSLFSTINSLFAAHILQHHYITVS